MSEPSTNATGKRYMPKVRTGCTVCKSRRVKCDEIKPHCTRCVARGEYCTYRDPIVRQFRPWGTLKTSGPSATVAKISLPTPRAAEQSYGSHEEVLSLHIYVHRIAPTIAIYFGDPSYWTETLPSVSWTNPTVKQALVAATLANVNATSGVISGSQILRANHHYNLAIAHLLDPDVKIEAVLSAGILTWLYEIMSGNVDNCRMHLASIRRLIAERMPLDSPRKTSLYLDSSPSVAPKSSSPRPSSSVSSAESNSSQSQAELAGFMQKVDMVAAECQNYTDQLFGSLRISPSSSPEATDDKDMHAVHRHTALLEDWERQRDWRSPAEAVNILEAFIAYFAQNWADRHNTTGADRKQSESVKKSKIAESIMFLNRWLIAFRTYTGGQHSEESRVVLQLYKVTFAIVQLKLSYAVDAANAGKQVLSRHDQEPGTISEDVWRLMAEANAFPAIKPCLDGLMKCTDPQVTVSSKR